MRSWRFAAFSSAVVVAGAAALWGLGIGSSQADTVTAFDTRAFRGVNWADVRDNFVDDVLVLGGLSTSDSYATTAAKTERIIAGFQNNLGANTIRLPVNYATVAGSYWNSYTAVVDTATAKGFRVILSYWESQSSRNGTVDDVQQFWALWKTIVDKYNANSLVYFEPFNEPYAYSDADWKNLAAEWLRRSPAAPRDRVIISGAGYNQRLITIGSDPRFDGTLISRHIYEWFSTRTDEAGWQRELRDSVGAYADRVVITEWGAPMTTGLNYNATNNGDRNVRFIRGVAAEARALGLGSVYWPGIRINDIFRLQTVVGSGVNLSLTTTNASGRDQLRYSWGVDGGPVTTPYRLTARHSGKVIEVLAQSSADGAKISQWTWNGGGHQKWDFQDAGGGYLRIVNVNSGKCVDVSGASTADGAAVFQYTCHGGANQQWQMAPVGDQFQLRARHSGKCLGVVGASTGDGADIAQYTCGNGTSQQWSRTPA